LPEESEGYLLARKDMCLLPHVPALVQNRIASLKIEGRMRTAELLAPVVGLAETDCVGCHPQSGWRRREGRGARPNTWLSAILQGCRLNLRGMPSESALHGLGDWL
jgi:hypothetical protein